MCLDTVLPKAFNKIYSVTIFVHWHYHQELPESEIFWATLLEVNETFDCDQNCLHVTLRAYVFGDRFLTPEFHRAANELFIDTNQKEQYYFCNEIGCELVSYAFENILADRAILQYMVDQYCEEWDDSNSDYGLQSMGDLPRAFVRRTAKCFQQKANYLQEKAEDEEESERCYEEHASIMEANKCPGMRMEYNKEHDYISFA